MAMHEMQRAKEQPMDSNLANAYGQMMNETMQGQNVLGAQYASVLELQEKQARLEKKLREEHQQLREAEYLASLVMPPKKGVPLAPKQPQQIEKQAGKKKTNVALELMDAMDYLLADIAGNVKRNPALRGLGTNFAVRRAIEALANGRASYRE